MKYIFDFYRNIVLTSLLLMPKDSDMRALKNAAVEDDDSDDYDHNNAHGEHDEDDHCEVLIVLREALFSVASEPCREMSVGVQREDSVK